MPRASFWFLTGTSVFAVVLAIQAAWLLSVDFTRPMLPYFPVDEESQATASAATASAETAASIGWVRGELWTDAAVAAWSGLADKLAPGHDLQTTPEKDHVRALAQRAATLSPADSRPWLLLAGLDSRFDWSDNELLARLKMSYFTGPNEAALAPLRIQTATRSTAIKDADLQSLAAREIQSLILRHPKQKEALVIAYRGASAEGRQFLESTVGKLDASLLGTMQKGAAAR